VKDEKEQRGFTSKVEIRADSEGETRKIVGYAVKWGERSNPIMGLFEERFEKGAFSESINGDIYAAWNHNPSEILGRTTSGTLKIYEDDVGLRYEITPPKWAERYIESIERGDVRGSSFIFVAEEDEWDERGEIPVRTVRKARLYEVSPVVRPAYPTSEAGVRSAEQIFKEYQTKKQPKYDFSYEEKLLQLKERE
jgi:uncharacterized protein